MPYHCFILNNCQNEKFEIAFICLSFTSMVLSVYTILFYPKEKFTSKLVTQLSFSDLMINVSLISFPNDD